MRAVERATHRHQGDGGYLRHQRDKDTFIVSMMKLPSFVISVMKIDNLHSIPIEVNIPSS